MVQRLNEIIVEKEGVMSEMEGMMRQFERDKVSAECALKENQTMYDEMVSNYVVRG